MTARPRPWDWMGPVLAGLIPLALYVGLRWQEALDGYLPLPHAHFRVVTLTSILAAVLAVLIGRAGHRLRNVQVTFLSNSLLSLAIVFSVHGLATPGLLLPLSPLPSVAAQLSVLLAAVWLALSVIPGDSPLLGRMSGRNQRLLVPLWGAFLLVAGATALLVPSIPASLPQDSPLLRWGGAAATTLLLGYSLIRFWGAYLYARMPLQRSLIYGTIWLVDAQLIIATGELWRLSWWIYHLLLLGATAALVVGLLRQHAAAGSVEGTVRALFEPDPVRRLEMAISDPVRALVVATETRDPYTAGHSLRIAQKVVRLGLELRLPPDQLRALAQGSLVHDVGKLEIPDRILHKPGPLTPEERHIVEKHPVTGYEMCRRLGFLRPELEIIRYHHERWDGSGYPNGLTGEEIPLLARVVAIADVYDALTSERVYRSAWNEAEAQRYIREEAGRLFDPRCVDASVRIHGPGPDPKAGTGWLHEGVQVPGQG